MRRHNRMKTGRNRKNRAAAAFLLPSLGGVALFVLIPFADVVRRSFLDAMGIEFKGSRKLSGIVSQFRLFAGSEEYHAVCFYLYSPFVTTFTGSCSSAFGSRKKRKDTEKFLSDPHGHSGGIHCAFVEVFISQPGVFECLLQ